MIVGITVGRNPYFGVLPLKDCPAALAAGTPGIPGAPGTGEGALIGTPPNIGATGLGVGAIAFQLGGTASAPIAGPWPMAADTPPPRPPRSATGAAAAPAASPAAAAAASPAAPAAPSAPPALCIPTRSVMVPNQLPGM
jgi:hypothetical protein